MSGVMLPAFVAGRVASLCCVVNSMCLQQQPDTVHGVLRGASQGGPCARSLSRLGAGIIAYVI